jgi:hypothetical protein
MMFDVTKLLFDGVKNMEFTEFQYVEEVEAELPVFTLTDIPVDEWNRRARINNTKMFVQIHERLPVNYEEVLTWVYSHLDDEYIPEKYKSHRAANTVTLQYS